MSYRVNYFDKFGRNANQKAKVGQTGRPWGALQQAPSKWLLLLLVLVIASVLGSVRLRFMFSTRAVLGSSSVHVQLRVQSSEHAWKLPMGQSPGTLVDYLNARSMSTYQLEPVASGTSVYATIVEENRLREVIDKEQVQKAKGFIAIWIQPSHACVEGETSRKIENFIRTEYPNVVSVAFVCFWNPTYDSTTTFTMNPFVRKSLSALDQALSR